MQIMYRSTRDSSLSVTASQAILKGLAPDGGLFVPDHFPKYTTDFTALSKQSYKETAFEVMSLMLTDYTADELKACIDAAYDEKFDTPVIAPLKEAAGAYYLELFHGATIAFKDMALSILPHLMTTAAKKNRIEDEIVILTATSGDTGKAAMAGFSDVPGTKIIVYYPKNGVSAVQEKQMLTQRGANVHVVGIRGNFDDAQTAVKKIFGDSAMNGRMAAAGKRFSSANSINIGRLVPQIVYYFYAYGQLIKNGAVTAGDAFNITVPTGNFGNILAALYAKKMGLPVKKLICASNENKVLVDFFATGGYDRRRDFILTSSPSMDILISSNLERLIYDIAGCDSEKTAALMADLSKTGEYRITDDMKEKLDGFYGNYATEEETFKEIARVCSESGYVIDTHTAVASAVYGKYAKETGDTAKTVIASTASPYKFARAVVTSIEPELKDKSDFELIDELERLSGVKIPAAIEDIRSAPILHDTVVDKDKLEEEAARWLGVIIPAGRLSQRSADTHMQ